MLTLLIPIGDYPFFVEAICNNIKNTGGIELNKVDLAFVVTSNPSDRLMIAFEKITIPHRIIETPINGKEHGVHLKLLDWSINFGTNSEWIYVQHADMFWQTNHEHWLNQIVKDTKDNKNIALTIPYKLSDGEFKYKEHKFLYEKTPLIRTHDFSGLYNRHLFLKHGLTFQWGKLTNLPVSNDLKQVINENKLQWLHRNTNVNMLDWVDGSDLIGLEIGIRFPNKIAEIKINNRFVHCWDMFGIASDIKREDDTIYVNRTIKRCVRGLPSYSWVSSHLFDKNDMYDKIFPWKLLKELSSKTIIPSNKSKICAILEKNATPNNPLLEDDLGIKTIKFLDYTYTSKKLFI